MLNMFHFFINLASLLCNKTFTTCTYQICKRKPFDLRNHPQCLTKCVRGGIHDFGENLEGFLQRWLRYTPFMYVYD